MFIELQIKEIIDDFQFKCVHDIYEINIKNAHQLDILLCFNYLNGDKKYRIGILFSNCICMENNNISLLNILELNNFTIKNMKDQGWENIKWLVQDYDEDGFVILHFYCNNITLEFINQH